MKPANEHEDRAPRQPKWRRYLRMIRPDPVADLDDELRDHLQSAVDALVAGGTDPADARVEALRRFGDVGRVRQEVQRLDQRHLVHANRLSAVETFIYDLRHGTRGLRKDPAFALVAAISIGLGVAANTTVFSVVNAVLLRPIPGAHAPRLARVYVNHHSPFDWHDLQWFRERATSLEFLIGERHNAMSFRAAGTGEPERIHASYVTHGYFPALGARVALGRAFDVDEAGAAEAVGVLSYSFWQRRFAGDSSVIGRRVLLGGYPITIVGVAASDFRSSVMMWTPDVIVPFAIAPRITGRKLDDFGGSFYATARLRDGVSRDAAESELRGLMAQLAPTDKQRYEGMTVRLDDIRGVNAELRGGAIAISAFMMAMVAMVLLIACANVANLLLGRAAARRTEIGVRIAIGAGRSRLVRQLLTEALLLAAIGSALGFAAAWALTRVIPAAVPAEAGLDSAFFVPDTRVLVFTGVLCIVTTLLFGTMPALSAASPNVVSLLKGDELPTRRRRGALVITQTALCVVLLAVATLFLRSLASMRGVDHGFRAEGVVDVDVDLTLAGHSLDRTHAFDGILRGASTLPGFESATFAAVVPLTGSNMETQVVPEGMTAGSRREYPSTYFNIVGPRYFETLRTPLRRGREFLSTDVEGAPRVAVANETAARKLWPNTEALGKRFHWGGPDAPLVEVVGIARDADYVTPGEATKPTIYMPYAQEQRGEMTLQVRTNADLPQVRRAIAIILGTWAPTLPPPPVVRMVDDMSITLLPVRAAAVLLGAFGMLALVLAAAGIYGVSAYSVARRRREIGIRAALGATRARLIRMVLWESGRRVFIGAAIGSLITVAVAAGLSRVLYGVRPVDPLAYTAVVVVICAVALVATFGPARRAAGADPVAAMRRE
jgi:putative ABC transport system permease protein